MARGNVPFLAFNRGLISPKALARVDLDRTRLSAETYTNWLPKTQGAMTLRPGTKFLGSSINDTGAEWIEFVAATDDTALIELTHQKMRIWLESDTGHSWETPQGQAGMDVPLARPAVDTVVTLSDTGWSNTSTGGVLSTPIVDVIPQMTAATTNGVEITASSQVTNEIFTNKSAWKAGDNNLFTYWQDTGDGKTTLPSWLNVDFGTSNTQSLRTYSLRAEAAGSASANTPSHWRLLGGNFDTGTYAVDTGKWTLEDTQGSETGWGASELRTYTLTSADTGTIPAYRHWRLYVTAVPSGAIRLAEIEMYTAAAAQQVKLVSGSRVLNATALGSLARAEKRVIVSDTGTEHSLAITVSRGPVTLRVGSSQRDDDYIGETTLGTGWHNLAFVPVGPDFWITLQNDKVLDRIVSSLTIGDSGTVEVMTALDAADLPNVRFDQSADVMYVDCAGVHPHKIERRGTGRSWSFVKYQPNDGPFLSAATTDAELHVNGNYGNLTATSSAPFFTPAHVGALLRITTNGQSGSWALGAQHATTDAVRVTGIADTGDTGTPGQNSERRLEFSITGSYAGSLEIQRSFEGPSGGFHPVSTSGYLRDGGPLDTGTFSRILTDLDDNSIVWYRVRMHDHASGVALVAINYRHGVVDGIARVTGFNSNTSVEIETLTRFSDTGPTDSWQEGSFSEQQGYPSAVALHEGRLAHAGGARVYLSVSDDYESFDDGVEGDAGPLNRTLGSGPVDSVFYLVSLLRMIIGTAGAELSMRSSSLDEPLTPTNSSAKPISTQGSANLRAIKTDTRAIFVQRSGQRVFMVGFGQGADAGGGDYSVSELTMLVPDLMTVGVVSVAVQRQPDTRIHCVLADGRVAILTYEPQEEVICWSMWETDGTVERAAVLPGANEDRVYYHVNRTINGSTKRYLERWAMESECLGDTGLSWLADCAKSFTHSTRSATVTGMGHLAGEQVIVWADDTGQSYPSKDLSYDTGGAQRTYAGGTTMILDEAVHHAVVGLPYSAIWKSTKLAYAAQAGTALAQMKRTDKIGFVLYRTHNNGLFFGNDTGNLDPLQRVMDDGAAVDPRKIYTEFDKTAMPFPGLWDTDSRIVLRVKAPRPCTVLAAIPTVNTNEKV